MQIHERGVNEDLLLVILKAVLRRRPGLKVVLMSATLNADKFAAFFPGAATVHIPGFTFPVTIKYLAEALTESRVTFTAEVRRACCACCACSLADTQRRRGILQCTQLCACMDPYVSSQKSEREKTYTKDKRLTH